jgi:anti-sigma B factor antagonist
MDIKSTVRTVGDVTIVDISGRIVLGPANSSLRSLVSDLLSKGHNKILLNLAEVNYIDSSGLGHLVSAFTAVRKQGGELKLLKLTNKVHDLMQITRLYAVFDISDDEAEAFKSFLFDLEQPEKCLVRGDSWMFAPEADYEHHGDVQDVVFPCGYTVDADGDTINLYYGAADSSIALARQHPLPLGLAGRQRPFRTSP